MTKKVISLGSLACGLFLLGTSANAAGFALQEQSVSGLGNAFAGGAAAMEDNSVLFSNPAALVGFDQPQLQVGLHYIMPETDFKNSGTTTANFFPTQGGVSASEESALVPNLYYSHPLSEKIVAGLGVSVPFGLTTEWGNDWVGRYIANRSELQTINIQPTIAYKFSENVSMGFGINASSNSAELTNALDLGLVFLNSVQRGLIPAAAVPPALLGDVQGNIGASKYDGQFKVEGDGVGYGYNVGLLVQFNDQKTRIGVHYRSEIDVELDGDVFFEVGALEPFLGSIFPNGGGKVDLVLPAIINLSIHHDINDQWSVMADAQRTGWSSFENLIIEFENPTPPDSVVPELWEDVWRYAIGTTYKVNDQFKLRGGISFEETPVPNSGYRSPRIPDADRTWFTLGMEYIMNENITLNAGAAMIVVDDPQINNNTHSTGQHLQGVMEASVNILSVSLVYNF